MLLAAAPGSARAEADEEFVGKRADLPEDTLIDSEKLACEEVDNGDWDPPYRFLLKIGEHADSAGTPPEWSLTLRSGHTSGETYELTLNQNNAETGDRFLTPVLNWKRGGYCVSDSSGDPPEIHIVQKIEEAKEAVQLSAAGAKKGATANFTSASDLFADPLSDDFEYKWANPQNPDETPSEHALWAYDLEPALRPKEDPVDEEAHKNNHEREKKARARLSAAFAPIVWLGLERYKCRYQNDCGDEARLKPTYNVVFTHCTGFFISRRVIMTNAHCVQRDDIDHRYAIRGWLRPPNLESGNTERLKAPELQKLTPVIVGDNGLDFALLWVEEANFKGPKGSDLLKSLPEPLHLTADPEWPYDPDPPPNEAPEDAEGRITIVGYPTNYALQASFDNYCRIRNNPFEGPDRKYPAVLAHSCDTLGGNSGSPVFDRNLRRVGALHNLGINATLSNCLEQQWRNCRNKAIRMSAIKTALEEVLSSLESDAAAPHMPLSPLPPGGRRETIDAGLRRRALEDIWCAQDEFLDSNPAFTGVCSDEQQAE